MITVYRNQSAIEVYTPKKFGLIKKEAKSPWGDISNTMEHIHWLRNFHKRNMD